MQVGRSIGSSPRPQARPTRVAAASRAVLSADRLILGGGGPTPPASDTPPADYQPPKVVRPPINGGAPALRLEEMDPSILNANPELKVLYAVGQRMPWALKAYQFVTKIVGPLGALVNLGYSTYSMVRLLRDRYAPKFLKRTVVASTALAGISTAAAVRVGLHAWDVWPMAAKSAMLAGKIAGITGAAGGALLGLMDTYNTFRDPKATPAAKGVSAVGTAAAFAMPVLIALGVGGLLPLGLGAVAMILPFLKNRLGQNATLNRICGGIGKGWQGLTGRTRSQIRV